MWFLWVFLGGFSFQVNDAVAVELRLPCGDQVSSGHRAGGVAGQYDGRQEPSAYVKGCERSMERVYSAYWAMSRGSIWALIV